MYLNHPFLRPGRVRRGFFLSALFPTFLTLTHSVLAEESPARWGTWVIEQETWQFLYREFSSAGEKLNQEKGLIPGGRVAWQSAPSPFGRWVAGYQYMTEEVDYLGRSNLGRAFSTRTKERFQGASAQWFYPLPRVGVPATEFTLVGSWHEWRRQIQPQGRITGLDEHYRWHQAGAGIKMILWEHNALSFSTEALWMRTIQPEMKVDMTDRREGYPKLKMKGRNGGRLGLETAYEMTPKLALTGTLAWQQWEFGASPIREVGDSLAPPRIREPESESRAWVLNMGLQASF